MLTVRTSFCCLLAPGAGENALSSTQVPRNSVSLPWPRAVEKVLSGSTPRPWHPRSTAQCRSGSQVPPWWLSSISPDSPSYFPALSCSQWSGQNAYQYHPDQESKPQPFSVGDDTPTNRATPARALCATFSKITRMTGEPKMEYKLGNKPKCIINESYTTTEGDGK